MLQSSFDMDKAINDFLDFTDYRYLRKSRVTSKFFLTISSFEFI